MNACHRAFSTLLLSAFAISCSSSAENSDGGADAGAGDSGTARAVFVGDGKPLDVRIDGDAWMSKPGFLTSGGCYNFLHAGKRMGSGDFRITLKLKLNRLDGARFIFQGNNHLILKDSSGKLAVEGPAFENGYRQLGDAPVAANKVFVLELARSGNRLSYLLDGSTIYDFGYDQPELGTFGVTPSLGNGLVGVCTSDTVMSVQEFSADGRMKNLEPAPQFLDIFKQGDEGYAAFRIPALALSGTGVLLAFCEARKSGISDTGNISLVLKRSSDGGASWGPLLKIAGDGKNTYGNPVPILDHDARILWLVFTYNDGSLTEADINNGKGSREIYVTHSVDEGLTWAEPVKISDSVKGTGWRWVASGPGHGIRTAGGRLVVPGNYTVGPEPQDGFSHVFFSADHGKSWELGGIVPGAYGDESSAAERRDGSLLLNYRTKSGTNRRWVSSSTDLGVTWSPGSADPVLIESSCQGSVLRLYSSYWDHLSAEGGTLVFSNPASTRRELLSVRATFDGAVTWPVFQWLYPGPSAYSDVVEMPDGSVGILFERGRRAPYEMISFARLPKEWIMQ
jgi:sialidase-1